MYSIAGTVMILTVPSIVDNLTGPVFFPAQVVLVLVAMDLCTPFARPLSLARWSLPQAGPAGPTASAEHSTGGEEAEDIA